MINQAGSTACLSKSKILHYLLEGTVGANAEIVGEEKDTNEDSIEGNSLLVLVVVCFLISPSQATSITFLFQMNFFFF